MTLSMRGLSKDRPYWEANDAWSSFEWEKGVFMNADAPVAAVLDFERWRRTDDGKTYRTTGLTDDQFKDLLAKQKPIA